MSGDRGYASVPERITWTTGFRVATDKVVLGALSTFANFQTGKGARVRVNKLAARAELKKRTVQRALHRLEADEWIIAVRRQHKSATAWDINVDKLATTWVAMKPVGGVMPSFPQAGSVLDVTSGAQLNVTDGAQLNVTSGAQIPCTERSPVQARSPVHEEPALRAAPPERSEPTTTPEEAPLSPPAPQQLTFGPNDVRAPPMRDPNWPRRFADTIRTALEETAERRKKHG